MAENDNAGQQSGAGSAPAADAGKTGTAPASVPATPTVDAEKVALAAERDKLAADLKKLTDAQLSREDKAARDAADATARAEKAEAAVLRYEICSTKNVPGDLIEFVTGNTKEELEASAQRVLDRFTAHSTKNGEQPNSLTSTTPQTRMQQTQSGMDGPSGTPQETNPAKIVAGIPRR